MTVKTTRKRGGSRSLLRSLKFNTSASLSKSMSAVKLTDDNVKLLLNEASGDSPVTLKKVARAMVTQPRGAKEVTEVTKSMLEWASVVRADEKERRKIVVQSFREKKGSIFLIHGISSLPRENARAFMKSYLDNGGEFKTVIEWLRFAGHALASKQEKPVKPVRIVKTAGRGVKWSIGGLISDAAKAFGDFVSQTVNSIADAISNIVDAVIDGAKSLGQAIAAAVSWTIEQIGDLVRALISAGKSVVAILTEALNRNVLEKFVSAVLAAGRAVLDIMSYAINQVGAVVQQVVRATLAAGRSLLEILQFAVSQVAANVQKVLSALIAIGKTVAQIVTEALRLASNMLQKVVGALILIRRAVAEILNAVLTASAAIKRTILEGIFMVGVYLADVVIEVCQNVAEGFRRGFFEGLVAIGHGMLDLLKAAATAGASYLAIAFTVILEMCGGYRPLTAAERAEAAKIFGKSIDLDRVRVAVASLPADLINYVNGGRAFTTMYLINFASWQHVNTGTLIHELTHVWQAAVAGPVYMVEALHSQFFGRGYNVTDADLAAANGDINKLQREQQAVVVERYWRGKYNRETAFADWKKYETLALCVYRTKLITLPRISINPDIFNVPLTPRLPRARRKTELAFAAH